MEAMKTSRLIFTLGIIFTILLHTCHSRTIDCTYVCLNGISSPYCNCDVRTPFRFGKRTYARVPFRFGKRGYEGNYLTRDPYQNERETLQALEELLDEAGSPYY